MQGTYLEFLDDLNDKGLSQDDFAPKLAEEYGLRLDAAQIIVDDWINAKTGADA